MNIIQSIASIRDALIKKKHVLRDDERQFKERKQTLLRERTIIQKMHRELKSLVDSMNDTIPHVYARRIRIDKEMIPYFDLAREGVRIKVTITSTPGEYIIEKDDVELC